MKLNNVLCGLSFAAIAYTTIAAESAPVIDISQTSSSPQSLSLQQRVANLERQVEARNRAQINVQRQLDELQNEGNELRGITEQHTHQLSQVLERQRELYQELDRRVSKALNANNSVPASIEAPANVGSTQYSSNLTENESYDRAVNMVLKDKRYDEAIPAFRAFNEQFPHSSYAANAHYWLGQLLFNKNDFNAAKTEFEVVVTQFTKSSKRSDAMLKLATVEQQQNNKAKAVSLYQQLIKDYPNSSAAKLAQSRLDSLL